MPGVLACSPIAWTLSARPATLDASPSRTSVYDRASPGRIGPALGVAARGSVVLGCCEPRPFHIVGRHFQGEHARAERLTSRHVFSRAQDESARWFGRTQRAVGPHAHPAGTVALRRSKRSVAVHPRNVGSSACWSEIIDYEKRVRRCKRHALKRVAGRSPTRRQLPRDQAAPKCLWARVASSVLPGARRTCQMEGRVTRPQDRGEDERPTMGP